MCCKVTEKRVKCQIYPDISPHRVSLVWLKERYTGSSSFHFVYMIMPYLLKSRLLAN